MTQIFFMLLVPGSFFIWLQDQFGDYPLEPGKSVLKLELVLELIFLSVSYKTEPVFELVLK